MFPGNEIYPMVITMEHLPYFPITNHEYPSVIKHGWLENGPFINDFPVQEPPFLEKIFQLAMFEYQRVSHHFTPGG